MPGELLPEELEALLSGDIEWKPDEQMKATAKRLRERGKVGNYTIPCPYCTNIFGEYLYGPGGESDGPISCHVCDDVAYKCEEEEYNEYNKKKEQAFQELEQEKYKWLRERNHAGGLYNRPRTIEERIEWIEEFIYERFFAEKTKDRVVRNFKK